MDKIKTVLIVAVSIVMDFLGILAIPVSDVISLTT